MLNIKRYVDRKVLRKEINKELYDRIIGSTFIDPKENIKEDGCKRHSNSSTLQCSGKLFKINFAKRSAGWYDHTVDSKHQLSL